MSPPIRPLKILSEKHHCIITVVLALFIVYITVMVLKFMQNRTQGVDFYTINTRLGKIKGTPMKTRRGKDIMSYRGIRYAEAPSGNLKFKPPIPIQPWHGVFDATQDGPICPQESGFTSEDCLRLNVYTPLMPDASNDTKSKLKPIIAYIGGYLFISGGSNTSKEGPEYLLDYDVLLVTINYRLGTYGLIATKEISGNNAYKDQLEALRWIRDNIEDYGGDPNQVTFMGWSAGAKSVMIHYFSETSKGLFHRSIIMSGCIYGVELRPSDRKFHWFYHDAVVRQADLVGCNQTFVDEKVECLRRTSHKTVGKSFPLMRDEFKCPLGLWPMMAEPNFDQDVFDRVILNFHHSPANKLLIGFTKDEFLPLAAYDYVRRGSEWKNATFFKKQMQECLMYHWRWLHDSYVDYMMKGTGAEHDLKVIEAFYSVAFPKQIISFLRSTNMFSFAYQNIHVNNFSNFTFNGSSNYIVHGDDKVYILKDSSYEIPLTGPENDHMEKVLELWTNFAKTGNPNNKSEGSKVSEINWEQFDSSKVNFQNIGGEWKHETMDLSTYKFDWSACDSRLSDCSFG